jgi:hypothetical protein
VEFPADDDEPKVSSAVSGEHQHLFLQSRHCASLLILDICPL